MRIYLDGRLMSVTSQECTRLGSLIIDDSYWPFTKAKLHVLPVSPNDSMSLREALIMIGENPNA